MDIAQSIYQLEKVTFSSDLAESVLQKFNFYFMRILSSRMALSIYTDEMLQTEITRILTGLPKQKALRLQELLTRLQRQRQIKQKNSLLQMLLKLGSFKDQKQIDTLFKTTRDLSSISQTNNNNSNSLIQMKKSLMEIETGLNAQLNNDQTLLKQRAQEPLNPLIKTIKNISDKGNPQIALREIDLISDCLYSFQGIEGHNTVYDVSVDGFILRKDISVSQPTRRLVNQLCELGWLFRKVQSFLTEQTESLIQSALQNGIKEEMNEYYRLIAILENMIQQDAQQIRQPQESVKENQNLSLRKLFLWSRNPLIQMTNLAVLISTIQQTQQTNNQELIISTLVSLQLHGCPIAHSLYHRLLSSSCVPLLRFINRWIYEGALGNAEFFVEREERNIYKDPGELWKKQYYVRDDKIPSILKHEQAYLIYDTGRVVNWIHRECQFKTWQIELPQAPLEQLLSNLSNKGNEKSFNNWLIQANSLTNQQLIELVFKKLKFTTHLQAIKRYLLLGQGEFTHTLMSIIQNELSKPALQIYKHNLIGLLESAIRSSNVQYLPQETIMRLDVKLLEASQGDTGWEIFCLDYQIDQPLNTILNQKAMNNYLRIFNFLWRVKRVEFTLAQSWKQQMKSEHSLKYVKELKQAFVICHSIRNQMQHFISNFYSYIMVESVETAWTKFNNELEEAKNLDSIINLHQQFQQEVLDGGFLTQRNEGIYRQILKIFDLIFRFKFIQEILIQHANESQTKKKNEDISNELRSIVGGSQIQSIIPNQNQNKKNQDDVKLLKELYQEFKSISFQNIQDFQDKLRKDEKLKFLSFRLDFNEYYYNLRNEPHFNMDLDKYKYTIKLSIYICRDVHSKSKLKLNTKSKLLK